MGVPSDHDPVARCDRCAKASATRFFGDEWGGYATLRVVALEAEPDGHLTQEVADRLLCLSCRRAFADFMSGQNGWPDVAVDRAGEGDVDSTVVATMSLTLDELGRGAGQDSAGPGAGASSEAAAPTAQSTVVRRRVTRRVATG